MYWPLPSPQGLRGPSNFKPTPKRRRQKIGSSACRRWRPLRAAELNAYVREVTGTDATTKDLRTLLGSATAAHELALAGPLEDPRDQERAIRDAVRLTADVLGNTPAVCRKAYIHPDVFVAWRDGQLARYAPPARAGAAVRERRALAFLLSRARTRTRTAARSAT